LGQVVNEIILDGGETRVFELPLPLFERRHFIDRNCVSLDFGATAIFCGTTLPGRIRISKRIKTVAFHLATLSIFQMSCVHRLSRFGTANAVFASRALQVVPAASNNMASVVALVVS
jgi:hypothetical protein